MDRLKTGLILLLLAALAGSVACSSDSGVEGQQAPAQAVQVEAQQAVEQADPEQVEQEESDGFDIGNRDHAAVRLTLLAELMRDANPVNDPLSWAKAGYASSVIDDICNDFDIHSDLDVACDQLLLAGATPWSQLTPVLNSAFAELRQVAPRRVVAEVIASGVAVWDAEAINFTWLEAPDNLSGTLSVLKDEMETLALGVPSRILDDTNLISEVLLVGLWIFAPPEDASRASSMVAAFALGDVIEMLGEFNDARGTSRVRPIAQRIVDELDALGVY